MRETASDSSSSAGASAMVTRFEHEYREYRRQKRVFSMIFLGAFLVCLGAAVWTTKFNPLVLIQGLPAQQIFCLR